MNQYFLVPEENLGKFIDGNKLIIPFNRSLVFYILLSIPSIGAVIAAPHFHKIYTAIILAIEMMFLLSYGNNKIELTKDESQNKLYVKQFNLICRVSQSYDFDLDSINFNVEYKNNKFTLAIINEYRKGNEILLFQNAQRIKPLIIFFDDINVKKFNDHSTLLRILYDFIGFSGYLQNTSINKYATISSNYNFIKYLFVNDHYFSFFESSPTTKKDFKGTLLKVIAAIMRFYYLGYIGSMISFSVEKDRDKNMKVVYDYIGFMFLGIMVFYLEIYLFGFCICKCISNKKQQQYKRVDIIYSNNFDKVSIGVAESDEKFASYSLINEFNLNDINRFVYQKNDINEDGFHLRALY